MSTGGRRVQAQGGPAAETQADLRAERVGRWLRVPLIIAALLAIPTIIVEESDLGRSWEIFATVLDWCIWAVFAANVAIMLSIVPDRRRWLTNNPLDVLIVVLTPPFLPATMKLARMLPVVRLVWLVVVARGDRDDRGLRGHLPNDGSGSRSRHRRNDRRDRLRSVADRRAGPTLPVRR